MQYISTFRYRSNKERDMGKSGIGPPCEGTTLDESFTIKASVVGQERTYGRRELLHLGRED